ncbi:hypothetical protein SLEP1_g3954 [Rubroshorea leprosula]|uniref:Reverse transcriptase domain-containing protein n=1 Tax=Rubroshorea leprosula TaxID=152421 RepID=A0AAV5HTL7_9ROSI|nr:hypothetical protein SLEP1_g3954 [Rubroshorea leprosula]
MWKTFLKFGRVFAIYSPQRKNKEGSRFGFVRFLDVKDERSLGRQLDQIWIGNQKLKIHPPHFNTQITSVHPKHHTNTARNPKPSYAEVVKGIGSRGDNWTTNRDIKPVQHGITNNSGKTEQKWVEKRRELHWTGLEFNPRHEDWEWLEGCFVGTARSIKIVPILQERLYMEGLFSIKLQAMGGKLVLMDCDDKEELKELCYGVPLHAWGPDLLISIANLWGNFITLDESTSSKKRFDVARFLISTSETGLISKTLTYKINGHMYCIKCKEEETTNGCFFLKADFQPISPSNSEEDCSESWSSDYPSEDTQRFGQNGVMHSGDSNPASSEDEDDVALKDSQAMGKSTRVRISKDLSDWNSANNKFNWQERTAICSQERHEEGCSIDVVGDSLTSSKNSNDFKILNGDGVSSLNSLANLENNSKSKADLEQRLEEDSDSAIENYNRGFHNKDRVTSTLDAWNLIKDMGLAADGNEDEIIKKIELTEQRDINAKKQALERNTVNDCEESKLEQVSRQTCRALWGTDDFEFAAMPSVGRSGGLICVWDNNILQLNRIFSGEHYLGLFGFWGTNRTPVHLINVYGPCNLVGRRQLWTELKTLITSMKGNWCVMGDFNTTKNSQERIGRTRVSRSMWDFANFIHESGLVDIPLIGRKYTWYHSSSNSMSRLDRFLMTEEWLTNWSETRQWDTWRTVDVQGLKGYCLKEKIKLVKKRLKNQATGKLNFSSSVELWRQKARKQWLREGDANSKFYHKGISSRQRRKQIVSLQVNGKKLEDVDNIKNGILEYFENLFKKEEWKRPNMDGISFKQISQAQNDLLVMPFSEDEIKAAVWDCGSDKAPGPDGFNFTFFKKMWSEIKDDIVEFVQEFHKNGKLVKGLNVSFLTLIPKVKNPQRIEEFRPISLIGSLYKIVAKLLTNRLYSVIADIIGEHQLAFIEGRHLCVGVVTANEIIDEAKRKKKKSFVFKVDFEKAFDKVNWNFLDYMMMRLGFTKIWRKWIMECLQTSLLSVLVNGSPSKQFPVSRGLKQGDPLSPFLFLIVAEGLNKIINTAIDRGLYEGIKVGNSGMRCSHIQFADDTIIFGEAFEKNIQVVKCIMRAFELASVLPFKYLGVPVGGNHRKLSMWLPLIESFKKKLLNWKARWLSFEGRITLLNSVLTSLPVLFLSVYLAPKGKDNTIDEMGRWEDNKWVWNLPWRRTPHSWEQDSMQDFNKLLKETNLTIGKEDTWT